MDAGRRSGDDKHKESKKKNAQLVKGDVQDKIYKVIVREAEPIVMVNQCDCVKKNKDLAEGEDETSSKANAPSEESSSGMGNPVSGSCQGEDIGLGTVRSNQFDLVNHEATTMENIQACIN
ncbi:hypothetical protein GOBAR_DD17240 [Gossypium barbadense]|nr:hypothetical protein GOBAR_DD17240 [Gossypium barbadense]